MTKPKFKPEKLSTICLECGHDWLMEFRSFEDCPYCIAYLHQAKQNPAFHKLILDRSFPASCHFCDSDLSVEDRGIERDGFHFCCLDCAIEYKRLQWPS